MVDGLSDSLIEAATDKSAYGSYFKVALTPLADLNRPEYQRDLWRELLFC
jgi:hypothetical protein